MSKVIPELMCPFGQVNESKYEQAMKAGKINKSGETEDLELKAGLVKAHFISSPMLATCCGVSACYDCIKEAIAEQYRRIAKKQIALSQQSVDAPHQEVEAADPQKSQDNETEQEKGSELDAKEESKLQQLKTPEEKSEEESKINLQQQATPLPKTVEICCPFCAQAHRIGETPNHTEVPFMVQNRFLDNLMSQEIQQAFDQLTE